MRLNNRNIEIKWEIGTIMEQSYQAISELYSLFPNHFVFIDLLYHPMDTIYLNIVQVSKPF